MILVGIGRAYHDSSICAYINGIIKYAKYERHSSIKHALAPEPWYWSTMIRWGIDIDNIDMIVETDGGYYSLPNKRKTSKLPLGNISVGYKHKHNVHKMEHYLLDHHLAHAWSNTSFNENSNAVVIDGVGSGDNTVMTYNSEIINRKSDISPGTMLSAVGGFLGIGKGKHLDNAGKVMGLVPYGIPDTLIVNSLTRYSPNALPEISKKMYFGDGIFPSEENANGKNWERIVNNVATFNELCYQSILKVFSTVDKKKEIIYSGGCALNVDWNRRLVDLGYKLNIEPHVYDGGLSIGCLRWALNKVGIDAKFDKFPYNQDDIAPDQSPSYQTINKVADLLAQGKIVAWYQGNGELGPRALGNRSILMDPTIKNGKEILNSKVKKREWFRPFGASVKEECVSDYFDLEYNPYMLFTSKVLSDDLHAVTHVDETCRHQTVNTSQNESFYSLLDSFERIKGIPILLNTSLNLGGKPISGNPQEAIELMNTTELDAVCIGDNLIIK